MKLSIIVAACSVDYPTAHYLGNCIGSIRYFSRFIDKEIIVIDNASKVELGHMDWGQYVDKYVKNEENKGVSVAWNQGIDLAKGEFVAFINSDVEVYEDWHTWMRLDLLSVEKLGLVMATPMYDMPFGRALEAAVRSEKYQEGNFLSDFRDYSCFMMRKETVDEIGHFDEAYGLGWGEDIDYAFRLEQAGYILKSDRRVNTHHIGMATGFALGTDINISKTMDENREYTKTKWKLDEHNVPEFKRHA